MRILVVDDETVALSSVRRLLKRKGHQDVDICDNGKEAISRIRSKDYDVAIIDLLMPGIDGLQVIEGAKPYAPSTEFIMLTAVEDAAVAFKALHLGAYDYLVKPVDNDRLMLSIERAYERKSLLTCIGQAKSEDSGFEVPAAFSGMITQYPPMKGLLSYVEIMSRSGTPILITGESGTGKELIAKGIHQSGPQPGTPFIAVNVASVPETLFESQFFGHARGAFTGAEKDMPGYFEQANGGTLFLDEIGELPIHLQAKLLRVLEDKTVVRIGDSRGISIVTRIVSATNQNLDKACQEGRFRLDLLYRLKSAHIHLPPLRDRGKDVLLLASHFLKQACIRHNKQISGFSPEALSLLSQETFPGNIRELIQWVEKAVLLSNSDLIQPQDLNQKPGDPAVSFTRALCSLKENDDIHTAYVLTQTRGNRSQAAQILGVSIRQIQRKLNQIKENPRLKPLITDFL